MLDLSSAKLIVSPERRAFEAWARALRREMSSLYHRAANGANVRDAAVLALSDADEFLIQARAAGIHDVVLSGPRWWSRLLREIIG